MTSSTYYSDAFYTICLGWSKGMTDTVSSLIDTLLSSPEPSLQAMFTEDEWDILVQIIEEVRCV